MIEEGGDITEVDADVVEVPSEPKRKKTQLTLDSFRYRRPPVASKDYFTG